MTDQCLSNPSAHLYLKGDARGGAFPFVVEPFSEDYTGRLSWRFLGNQLLRCASLHAGMCGFGYDDMQEAHHVWVLSRLVVELEEMPRTNEAYTIETWVSRIYRQFTDRLYAITGNDGRAYGFAHSTWALIDVQSRQPMELSTLPDDGFVRFLIDRDVPIKGAGRIRLKTDGEPARTLQAYYSDLDINGHVNSIRYIEMMLDLFPKSLYDATPVRRIEVAYSAESYCGDVLKIYTTDAGNGTHLVEIQKEGGVTVVKAAITFG
ncbi:MAG: thioesterase [Bacteroidales bacterium]|nr:thioesterase [Bacteroidales bacterium]